MFTVRHWIAEYRLKCKYELSVLWCFEMDESHFSFSNYFHFWSFQWYIGGTNTQAKLREIAGESVDAFLGSVCGTVSAADGASAIVQQWRAIRIARDHIVQIVHQTIQVSAHWQPVLLHPLDSNAIFPLTFSWNEWVNLPHLFSELPRTAMLAITILDCAGAGETMVIGGTTISLFGKNGTFRQGMFDLRVWVDVEADGNAETQTPGKGKDLSKNQMQRLAKLAKKHRNGQIPKVDWLDRLTFREIEMINEKEKTESDYLYLLIEFPTICCEQTNQTVSVNGIPESGERRTHFQNSNFLCSIR